MTIFASASERGFFDSQIHPAIPSDGVEISPEYHAQLMQAQADGKVIKWAANGMPLAVAAPPPSLDAAKAAALRQINAAATDAIATIAATYPQFEIDTWQDQEAEARAWLADNAAPTPTLSPIAAARGITMADLCARVIAKADAYRPAVAAVIGQRQALEDAIAAAASVSAVQAITWPMG